MWFDFAVGVGNAPGQDPIETDPSVEISYSDDGGYTWNCCNVGSTGTLAQYPSGPINTSWTEPELGVLYRFNCVAYTSGTINYRMSQNSGGAMSLTLGGVAY